MKQIKYLCVVAFLLLFSFELYSQSTLNHTGLYGVYRYINNAGISNREQFMFRDPDRIEFIDDIAGVNKIGTYILEVDYGVPFLNIRWSDGTTERYLMLSSDNFICLYDNNSEPVFFGWHYTHEFADLDRMFSIPGVEFLAVTDHTGRDFDMLARLRNVTASSTLAEGNIRYPATPERLGLHINRVWAANGGINERLYVTVRGLEEVMHLYISVGYVHYSQPNLYLENSRPRKIRISSAETGEFMDVELVDTPNFQRIPIRFLVSNWHEDNDLIIEILEIYPGTKFNHMSINSVMEYGAVGP